MLNRKKYEEASNNKKRGFTVCGCCYKEFIKAPGSLYKTLYDGKMYHFCSYTCYNKIIKWKET